MRKRRSLATGTGTDEDRIIETTSPTAAPRHHPTVKVVPIVDAPS